MARAPRVFTWSDGLHVYTVATSSKVKALAAWGVTRDLFKDGEAEEVSAGPDLETALARPGEVVRRKLEVRVAPGAEVKSSAKRAPKPPPAPRPSKADLARASTLEREIAGIGRDRESLETEIAARRARLEREAVERRAELDRRRAEAEADLKALRAKIGGR